MVDKKNIIEVTTQEAITNDDRRDLLCFFAVMTLHPVVTAIVNWYLRDKLNWPSGEIKR